MAGQTKSFAETYTMRSRFWHDLGEIGKKLAELYVYDADLENRAAIKELTFGAMVHSLTEHHSLKPEEIAASGRPDPLEVLAFIESGMSMTTEQIAARWPEWAGLREAAMTRFDRECNAYRVKWGEQARGSSDPMVDNYSAAWHHWVYLPLIRSALAPSPARGGEGVKVAAP